MCQLGHWRGMQSYKEGRRGTSPSSAFLDRLEHLEWCEWFGRPMEGDEGDWRKAENTENAAAAAF